MISFNFLCVFQCSVSVFDLKFCDRSLTKSDVKAVPRLQINCDVMYECFMKIYISARSKMSVSPFIRGNENRYFEKSSIPKIMKA